MKHGATIVVSLKPEEYPGPFDVTVARTFSAPIIQRAFQPLDEPTPDADPIVRNFICTPPPTIEIVKRMRNDAAEAIAKELTEALLEAMAQRDTTMGYKRARA